MEGSSRQTSCGYTKSCTPKFLQRFSNPKTFLVVVTLFAIVQGFAISGVNNSNTVMYERRYQLTSRETSLVSIMFDVSAALVVIPVGYYGTVGHQPRILAISSLVMCCGMLVMCLAHFTSPPYNYGVMTNNSNEQALCNLEEEVTDTCSVDVNTSDNMRGYLAFLIIGQILNGYTGAVLYTLGITFIEQTTTSAQSALYIGIMTSGAVLGPAVGFLSSGAFLTVYVDYPASPPQGLDTEDPAWVGAWWFGFLIAIVLCAIFASVLFLFPPEFADTAKIREEKVSEAHTSKIETKVNHSGFGMSWKQLPHVAWGLLKNPCYMLLIIADSADLGLTLGFATFFPKFLVVAFNLNASIASILTGAIAIPAGMIGQLTSGIVIMKWNFNLKQILMYSLICSIASMCLVPVYLARCADVTFAGVTQAYQGNEKLLHPELDADCNAGCGCSQALYHPVCSDGIQYFSGCHAGCLSKSLKDEDNGEIYYNCTCAKEQTLGEDAAQGGKCDVECTLLYSVLVPFGFLQFFSSFMLGTAMAIACLRVVPSKIRTFGSAFQMIFLRLLGSVPGPLLFGAMFDASCLVWQDDCGKRGSCWVYDTRELTIRITLLALGGKLISVACNAVAVVLYKQTSFNNNQTALNDVSGSGDSTGKMLTTEANQAK